MNSTPAAALALLNPMVRVAAVAPPPPPPPLSRPKRTVVETTAPPGPETTTTPADETAEAHLPFAERLMLVVTMLAALAALVIDLVLLASRH